MAEHTQDLKPGANFNQGARGGDNAAARGKARRSPKQFLWKGIVIGDQQIVEVISVLSDDRPKRQLRSVQIGIATVASWLCHAHPELRFVFADEAHDQSITGVKSDSG